MRNGTTKNGTIDNAAFEEIDLERVKIGIFAQIGLSSIKN
jgi:hypothetical protein